MGQDLFLLKSRTMLKWFPDSQECRVCQNQGRSVSQYDQMWSCCEVLNLSFSIPNRVCGRCTFYDVVYWMWTKHLFHLWSNRSVIMQMYSKPRLFAWTSYRWREMNETLYKTTDSQDSQHPHVLQILCQSSWKTRWSYCWFSHHICLLSKQHSGHLLRHLINMYLRKTGSLEF